jgi:hypothetical protein
VIEGPFAYHMPVIVGPTPDEGVELGYQRCGCGLFVDLHDLPDFPEECLHILPGGFDQKFSRVLTYMLAQKIEAVLNVRDAGFLR